MALLLLLCIITAFALITTLLGDWIGRDDDSTKGTDDDSTTEGAPRSRH